MRKTIILTFISVLSFLPLTSLAVSYGTNVLIGGTPTADNSANPGSGCCSPDYAVDSNTATRWETDAAVPHWWKYDLGTSTQALPSKLSIYQAQYWGTTMAIGNFRIQTSENDSTWTTIFTSSTSATAGSWANFTWEATSTPMRYLRIYIDSSNEAGTAILNEIEMFEDCDNTRSVCYGGGTSSSTASSTPITLGFSIHDIVNDFLYDFFYAFLIVLVPGFIWETVSRLWKGKKGAPKPGVK